jgi:hypothetical protein
MTSISPDGMHCIGLVRSLLHGPSRILMQGVCTLHRPCVQTVMLAGFPPERMTEPYLSVRLAMASVLRCQIGYSIVAVACALAGHFGNAANVS